MGNRRLFSLLQRQVQLYEVVSAFSQIRRDTYGKGDGQGVTEERGLSNHCILVSALATHILKLKTVQGRLLAQPPSKDDIQIH